MILKKAVPADLVEVIWLDAETDSEWDNTAQTKEDDLHTALCITVGFIVKETKTFLYISHTVSTDKDGDLHWNGRIRIPHGMVKSKRILQKKGS